VVEGVRLGRQHAGKGRQHDQQQAGREVVFRHFMLFELSEREL
jgi:hypothetical protein